MNLPVDPIATAAVDAAITSRRSIRAFLPTPVPRETIAQILSVAARAPSGTNTQPWKVHVLTGAARDRMVQRLHAVHDDPAQRAQLSEEYAYYPTEWQTPYIERRRKVGWDLYGLLGIGKADKTRMHAQHGRNYTFFDAPVGLIVTLDRRLNTGSFMDVGMFIQNILVAARAQGLHTCAQAAFAWFHKIAREQLPMNDSEILLCGIALGHEDLDAPENAFITERAGLDEFVSFHGFEVTA